MSTDRDNATPGGRSDPQERKGRPGHDGQPQPAEAKPAPPADITVNTADDDYDPDDPLANVPAPKGDTRGRVADADERLLKPVLHNRNDRSGGG